jgi:pimeloyl-ACP methyl ester carboxylesterase
MFGAGLGRRRRRRSPGSPLHALHFGDPSAPSSPVVLLHGQPGRAAVWRPVAEELAARGRRVLAVDRPGYGRTAGRAAGFTDNAEAVLGLLDHEGIDRATVVAHSWASGIALALATAAPERVDGMVLLAPVGSPESVTALDHLLAVPVLGWGLLRSALRLGAWALDRDGLRRFLPAGFGDLDPIEAKRMAGSARSRHARRSAAREQRSLVSELAFVRERAVGITIPTVVLSGSHDRIVPPAAARSLADRIEGARMQVVEAGHLLPAEAPEEVAEAVDQVSGRSPVSSGAGAPLIDRRAPVPTRSCSSSSGP